MPDAIDPVRVVKKLDAEAGEWLAALRVGYRRIGGTPAAQLAWLLRFAEMSERPESMDGRQAELEAEIYAFMGSAAPASSGARPAKLNREALMRVALQVGQGVQNLMNGRRWYIDVDMTGLRPYVAGPQPVRLPAGRRLRGRFSRGYSAFNWESAFLMRAADLTVEHGARIRRCAWHHCRRLFVRRKGGLYCSKACSQKERTARMQRKLGRKGWSNRRHVYYQRKVQQLHGQAVATKVRRRVPKGR